MRKLNNIFISLLFGTIGFGCYSWVARGDAPPVKNREPSRIIATSEPERPRGLDELINSTYKLHNTIQLEGRIISNPDNREIGRGKGTMDVYASCVGIGRDESGRVYLLTADHATINSNVQVQMHAHNLVREEMRQANQNLRIVHYVGGEERDLVSLEEVASDEAKDISLLRTVEARPELRTYGRFAINPRLGETTYSVGYPHHGETSFGRQVHRGIVSGIDFDNWEEGNNRWLVTSSVLDRGASGGPTCVVRDTEVYIIGINSMAVNPEVLRQSFGITKGLFNFLANNPDTRRILRIRRTY